MLLWPTSTPFYPSLNQTCPEMKLLKCKGIFNYYFPSFLTYIHVLLFFFASGKAARFAEFIRPRTLSDTWFQLDIFLCFLVLACLGLLLSSLPLPSPPTPSLLNSPLLFPISLPMSSFSQSPSEYVASWTTVPCFVFIYSLTWRLLTAWHPMNDFKLWHRLFVAVSTLWHSYCGTTNQFP